MGEIYLDSPSMCTHKHYLFLGLGFSSVMLWDFSCVDTCSPCSESDIVFQQGISPSVYVFLIIWKRDWSFSGWYIISWAVEGYLNISICLIWSLPLLISRRVRFDRVFEITFENLWCTRLYGENSSLETVCLWRYMPPSLSLGVCCFSGFAKQFCVERFVGVQYWILIFWILKLWGWMIGRSPL